MVLWRGSRALRRQQATWDFQAEKVSVTVDYVGPYETCLDQVPRPGTTVADFDRYGLTVGTAKVIEGLGDSGRISLVLEAEVKPGSEVTSDPIGEPIYEIVWGELTKALETHPDCGKLWADRPKYGPDGAISDKGKRRTWDDWADLTELDYDDTGDGVWSLETYQAKRRRGQDSYPVGAPVITRTMPYYRKPIGVGANVFKPQEPPAAADAPEGWEWLLTADECSKQGRKRTRKTVWTGFEVLDEDIYPSAST